MQLNPERTEKRSAGDEKAFDMFLKGPEALLSALTQNSSWDVSNKSELVESTYRYLD